MSQVTGRNLQAGFQLTRIDEEGAPQERLGSKATIAVLAHGVLNPDSSGGKSLAETRLEVNAVWRFLAAGLQGHDNLSASINRLVRSRALDFSLLH